MHGEHRRAGTVLNPDVTPGGKEGTQARVLQVEGKGLFRDFYTNYPSSKSTLNLLLQSIFDIEFEICLKTPN